MPNNQTIINAAANSGNMSFGGTVAINAAAGDGKRPSFDLTVYNGGLICPMKWKDMIVIDCAGVSLPTDRIPLYMSHEKKLENLLGQTETIVVNADSITASGILTASRETSVPFAQMVDHNRNGFAWQCSVGAKILQSEYCQAGRQIRANGRTFDGPCYVARKIEIDHIAIVDIGADSTTTANIAAQGGMKEQENTMPFEDWIKSLGLDIGSLTPELKAKLQESYDALKTAGSLPAAKSNEPAAGQKEPEKTPANAGRSNSGLVINAAGDDQAASAVAAIRAKAAGEINRIAAINKICAGHSDLAAKGIEEGWDEKEAELAVLRASRSAQSGGTAFIGSRGPSADAETITASMCLSAGMSEESVAKQIPADRREKVLNAALSGENRNCGLQDLMHRVCLAAGRPFYGSRRTNEFIRAAKEADRMLLASGASSMSLSGIMSNVANKFLLESFGAVEPSWKEIAAIRNVSDFKTATSYRMNAEMEFKEVGPGGELAHGTASEESFTNKAKTYGRMFAVTRQDIINDDMGALTSIPKQIGRNAGLSFNGVFWKEFLADAGTFYTTGRGNYKAGTDTVLGVDSLDSSAQMLVGMKDAAGRLIGATPRILLVPSALSVKAATLMSATEIRDTTASTKYPTYNPFVGKFKVVSSAYLGDASYTGYSATAWYLMADPRDLPVIEVAFLNGIQTPTIEQDEADFNTLGIQFRGYFDFGVAKQDYRAAVKFKGAA